MHINSYWSNKLLKLAKILLNYTYKETPGYPTRYTSQWRKKESRKVVWPKKLATGQ
jgi:hypothetical protein